MLQQLSGWSYRATMAGKELSYLDLGTAQILGGMRPTPIETPLTASLNNSVNGLFLQAEFHVHPVGHLVCSLVMNVYCAKMANSIKMPFGMVGHVCIRNHVLDGGPAVPWEKSNFGC